MPVDKYILLRAEDYERLVSINASGNQHMDIQTILHTEDGIVKEQGTMHKLNHIKGQTGRDGMHPPFNSPSDFENHLKSGDKATGTGQNQLGDTSSISKGLLTTKSQEGRIQPVRGGRGDQLEREIGSDWFEIWEGLNFVR